MVTGHAHLHQRCCKQIIACQYGYFIIENGINGELSTAFSTFVHYIIVHKAGIMKKFQRNRSMQGCRTYLAKKLRSQKHQNGAHHLPVLLPDMRNYAVQQKVGTGEGTFKKLLEVLQFLRIGDFINDELSMHRYLPTKIVIKRLIRYFFVLLP